MYNSYYKNKIYDYRIDYEGSDAPVKIGEYTIPYSQTQQPNLAFNYQRGVLEVISDHWTGSPSFHYFMDLNGEFSKKSVTIVLKYYNFIN